MVASRSSTRRSMRSRRSGPSQPRLRRLQPESDREQALDHQVVQVAADPVAVLEERQALLGLASPATCSDQGGLLGEAGR